MAVSLPLRYKPEDIFNCDENCITPHKTILPVQTRTRTYQRLKNNKNHLSLHKTRNHATAGNHKLDRDTRTSGPTHDIKDKRKYEQKVHMKSKIFNYNLTKKRDIPKSERSLEVMSLEVIAQWAEIVGHGHICIYVYIMAGKKIRSAIPSHKSIERQKALNKVNGKEDDQSANAMANRILQSRQLAIRGNEAANVGQYAVAVRLFTDAINLDPNDHRFFGNRSYCYDQLGQYEEALNDAEKAIKIAPHWPKGHFRKGLALKGLTKYIESERAFEQVLQLDKGCEEAQMELINVRISRIVEMGFTEQEAKQAIKKHIHVQPAVDALMSGEFRETMDDVFYSDDDDEFIPSVTKTETLPKEVKKVVQPQPKKDSIPTVVVQNNTTPNKSTSPKNPKGLTSLWVGNILPEVTEKMIIQLFSKQGQVTSVRLLKEKFCAFVNFSDKNAAARALDALQGQDLCGQNLLIKFPDNPIVNGAQDIIIRKNKSTTVVKTSPSPTAATTTAPTITTAKVTKNQINMIRPKGPVNGDECYFYRTTGCVFGDSCKFKHISKNKGVDRKPWQV
ncbi:unnamed protein product, partial [Meganyctiphanes norvegica]